MAIQLPGSGSKRNTPLYNFGYSLGNHIASLYRPTPTTYRYTPPNTSISPITSALGQSVISPYGATATPGSPPPGSTPINPSPVPAVAPTPGAAPMQHHDTYNYQWALNQHGVAPGDVWAMENARKLGNMGALPGWLQTLIGQNLASVNAANGGNLSSLVGTGGSWT